jgi:septal ring factor EnvC (AmiA/AmiB activator)
MRHAVLAGLLSLAVVAGQPYPVPAQDAATKSDPSGEAAPLVIRRNATEAELREIARSISQSAEKAAALEKSIAAIEKTKVGLRTAIVESARRRKDFERQIASHEKSIAELAGKEAKVKTSLLARRDLLAEVLAALQRMGRNPPPALLVTPDDALSSVRSAILLGAVVPGIRSETDKLAGDLQILADLRRDIAAEKEDFVVALSSLIEEGRRMDLLIARNDELAATNARELGAERKRAGELASRATSLEGLIVSLERDITSVREAAALARAEELRRQGLSPSEREKAKALAESGAPDKNRIAPAYAFSELKGLVELPATGSVIRHFGDDDGTGHMTAGMTLESGPSALVTAPADAWIVFAGPFRSYGETIILNLGDGYHMVMTGMDQVIARQGQFVVAGEPLGQMGEKRVASAAALALETERQAG